MGLNKRIVSFFDSALYSQYQDKWDDRLLRDQLLEILRPEHIVLDVGAGRGRVQEMNFKGQVKKIIGIDPDPRVKENPLIDEGYEGLADHMPFFEDNFFDVVFCDNVLEHVEFPDRFYKEIARVLKPGGFFISKTPNRFYYVAIIAAITPESFHKFINKKRGRNESDTFPTFYRANTKQSQNGYINQNGLTLVKASYFEGRPEYMRIFFPLYVIGYLFERTVNLLNLNGLKAIIITVSRKN